jgi:NTE family protein
LIKKAFQIYSGTSVGALNTSAMAALATDPKLQAEKIKEFWFTVRQEDIYRRDLGATTHFLGSTLGGILRNLFTFNPFRLTNRKGPHFNSFLDTTPLKNFLNKLIPWNQITKNVKSGLIDAVAINVTNLQNGRHELFLQKNPDTPYQGHYKTYEVDLSVEHALASAALPIIFPPIKIGEVYFADGGLRLFTPMSPAIQLGADRLVVIGLRYRSPTDVVPKKMKSHHLNREPTIALQMGRMLNGVFLDRIEYDMEQLERINTIVETSEKVYGNDYLKRLNQTMAKGKLTVDIANRGLRKIRALEIKPSHSISTLFIHWAKRAKKQGFTFSAFEKMLMRLLDIDPETGSDLLSYVTFAPEYLKDIFELGYQDGKRFHNDLVDILED